MGKRGRQQRNPEPPPAGYRNERELVNVILVCVKVCRSVRLRGGRSCADSARGTHPSGLPFSVAAGIEMAVIVLALPAKRMAGRVGEYGKSFHSRV